MMTKGLIVIHGDLHGGVVNPAPPKKTKVGQTCTQYAEKQYDSKKSNGNVVHPRGFIVIDSA